ncbi:MAG: 2-phospho-L-lactate guanylyltransferase [Caulobacteraceae bacterium]|nr:2-phospho-L-lactate guanylyltransferase [Caulobacteraceae bacterium]
MTAQVVIAVRGGPDAKSRCRERLGEAERAELVEAMLEDMLDALAGSKRVGRVHVATPTPALARLAAQRNASAILETPGGGLNAAFDNARRLIAAQDPEAPLALMPGDLPLLEPAELEAALAAIGEGQVGLVASADGGTGAVLLRAGRPFGFAFGPGSFRRHLAAAEAAGLAPVRLEARSLAFDVDGPEDLDRLAASGGARRSARLVRAARSLREACT